MKKVVWISFLLCLLLAIAGCGAKEKEVTKYTVTFVSEQSTVETLTAEEGEELTLSTAVQAPQKPSDEAFDYTFKGWSLTEGGSTLEQYTVTGDVTFYAVFDRTEKGQPQPAEPKEYALKLHVLGEESSTSYKEGAALRPAAPELPSFVNFEGWFTDENFSSSASLSSMPGHDVDLYAKCTLKAPQGSLSNGYSFVYGEENRVEVSGLTSAEGLTYSYQWQDGNGGSYENASFVTLRNAGDYQMKVVITASYKGLTSSSTLQRSYTVAKRSLKVTVTVPALTYGEVPAPQLSYEGLLEGDGSSVVTVQEGAFSYTSLGAPVSGNFEAGSYILTVDASKLSAENYSFGRISKKSFSVEKATLTASLAVENSYTYGDEITPTLTLNGFKYDDKQETLGVQPTYRYTGEKSGSPLPAGSYTLTAALSGMRNYNDVQATAAVTVEKKQLTVSFSGLSESYVYGKTPAPKLSFEGFVGRDTSYAVSGSSSAISFTKGGEPFTGRFVAGEDYAAVADISKLTAENYTFAAVQPQSFAITKAPLALSIDLLGSNIAEEGHSYTYSYDPSARVVYHSYAYYDETDESVFGGALSVKFVTAEGGEPTYSATRKLNVGSYKATIVLEKQPDNYQVTVNEIPFTIAPQTISIILKAVSAVYGDEIHLATPDLYGLVLGEESLRGSILAGLTYVAERDGKATPLVPGSKGYSVEGDFLTVGSYTLKAQREEFPNYSIRFTDGALTVSPRPYTVKVTASHTRSTPFTYSPTLSAADAEKFAVEGTLTFSARDIGLHTVKSAEELAANSAAWTTPLKFTLKNGTDVTENFSVSYDVNVTVTASIFGYTLPEGREFTYDKAEHAFAVTVSVDEADSSLQPTISYTVNGTQAEEVKVKDAGTYRVSFTISAENYETVQGNFVITVNKVQGTIDTSPINKQFTYTGQLQTVTGEPRSNNDEDARFTFSNNTFTTVPQGNALEVSVTLEEGKNYTGATATFFIQVNKMKLDKLPEEVVFPKMEGVGAVGSPIGTVEIPDGRFSWKNPEELVQEGIHDYAAYYFVDRDNIEGWEGKINLSTKKVAVLTIVGGEEDYVKGAVASSYALVRYQFETSDGKPLQADLADHISLTYSKELSLSAGNTFLIAWNFRFTEHEEYVVRYNGVVGEEFAGKAVFKWKSVDVDGKLYTIEDALKLLTSGKTATVKYDTAFASKEVAAVAYPDASYYTVKKDATLLVPYDSSKDSSRGVGASNTTNTQPGINGTTHSPFTGSSLGNATLCDLTLTVPDGVELFNEGTLKVGGITTGGNGGTAGAGQTNSGYARIVLGQNAKINSTGAMTVFGFIEEAAENNGSRVSVNAGSLTMPFIVVEHRGGTKFSNIYGDMKGSPFNRFYLQNVTCFYEIKAGAELFGHANLYAGSQDNATDVAFVGGEGHFIQLQEGAYVTLKYNTTSKVTAWDFYGDIKINALSLSISIADLSTDGILFPLSWYHLFNFHTAAGSASATVDATAQDIKILPGGAIVIDKGVTFQIGSLFVYDASFKDPATNTGVVAAPLYETDKGEGKLVVNGKLIADALGGLAQTEEDGATLTIAVASQVSYELVNADSLAWRSFMKSAEGKIWNNNGEISQPQPIGAGTAVSKDGGWIAADSHYTIEYSYGYRTADGQPTSAPEDTPTANNPAFFLAAGRKLLPASLRGYEFLGWFTDDGFTKPITEISAEEYQNYQENGSTLKLYGLFQKLPDAAQNYELTLNANGEGALLGEKSSLTFDLCSDRIAQFELDGCVPVRSGYDFLGWFRDAQGSGEAVHTLSAGDFAEGKLSLWAKWEIKKFTLTIELEMLSDVTGTVTVTIDGQAQESISTAGSKSFVVPLGASVKITVAPGEDCVLDSIVSTPEGYVVANGDTFKMPEQDVTVSINVEEDSSWCVIEGTLITMADGTQKPVEELKPGEMVMVFNHETGKYEAAPVLYNVHSGNVAEKATVIYLTFADGTRIGIAYKHFFFDLDLNRYVNISEENAYEFIGHKFAKMEYRDGAYVTVGVTLAEVTITEETVRYYSPVSVYHTNLITEGLLSHTTWPVLGNPEGFMNYFAYDADMKFNEESMQADIEQYGLYTYEDFEGVLSEEAFYAGPWKYFKVAVGKGNLSWKDILAAIDWLYHSGQLDPL